MPNINEMRNSKFLTKTDVTPDVLATIVACEEMDVSMEDDPEEMKWCLTFKELDKPLVLNWTNTNMVAVLLNDEETDNWAGKQIVLFNDKSITYKRRITGGIRVRAVKQTFKQAISDQAISEAVAREDDIPNQPRQTMGEAIEDAEAHRDKQQARNASDDDIPF